MAYYLFFSRRFWVKEPGHSENVSEENCSYRYRRMHLLCDLKLSFCVLRLSIWTHTHGMAACRTLRLTDGLNYFRR